MTSWPVHGHTARGGGEEQWALGGCRQVPAWDCGARGGGKRPGAGQGAGVGCSRVVPLAQAGGSAWKQEVSLF